MSTAPLRLVTPEDHLVVIQTSSQVPRIESETELRSILATLSGVDSVGAEARVAKLATRSIKKSTKMAALDLAISMVDLTTLEGADEAFADELAFLAAGSIKRVLRPGKKIQKNSIHRLRAFVETSTVWHTIGQ